MITRRLVLAGAGGFLAAPALAQRVVRIPRDWLPTDMEVARGPVAGAIHVGIGGRGCGSGSRMAERGATRSRWGRRHTMYRILGAPQP